MGQAPRELEGAWVRRRASASVSSAFRLSRLVRQGLSELEQPYCVATNSEIRTRRRLARAPYNSHSYSSRVGDREYLQSLPEIGDFEITIQT